MDYRRQRRQLWLASVLTSTLRLQPPRAVRRTSVGRLVDHRRERQRPDISRSCHRPLGGRSAGMPQKECKSCDDRPCCGSDFCGGFGDAAEPSLPFRYEAINSHQRSPCESHEHSPRDESRVRGRWPSRRRQKILYLRDDRGIGDTSAHSCEREGSDGQPKRARGHKGSAHSCERGERRPTEKGSGAQGSRGALNAPAVPQLSVCLRSVLCLSPGPGGETEINRKHWRSDDGERRDRGALGRRPGPHPVGSAGAPGDARRRAGGGSQRPSRRTRGAGRLRGTA